MSRKQRVRNNSTPTAGRIPSHIEMAKKEGGGEGPARMKIHGYNGNAVSLQDYGIEDPVVYSIAGIEVKNKIPYLLDHSIRNILGHTENVTKTENSLSAEAVHSFPSSESKKIAESIDNGVPFQASMGLDINGDDVTYHTEGSVVVNGRTFNAPVYVVHKSKLVELSATLFGRDEETEIVKLAKETFMTVKNSATGNAPPKKEEGKEKNTPPTTTQNGKGEETNPPAPKEGEEEESNGKPSGTTNNSRSTNQAPPQKKEGEGNPDPSFGPQEYQRFMNGLRWQKEYKDHPDLILNAINNGWDDDRLKREVEIAEIENGYPTVPNVHVPDNKIENSFLARMAFTHNVSPEFIENKLGKKAADHAVEKGPMGLKEMLMYVANSEGGRFNGHSDVPNMCRFIKQRVTNMQWSTIDFPNLMHRIAEYRIEEAWKIEEPWAPRNLREVNNRDFKPTGHLRPSGGTMWEGLNNEGKIRHGSFGEESTYTTKLDTIGQILTFKREDIINDDIGWIDEVLDLMIEGAMMYPDYQFVNKIYTGLTRGWLKSDASHFTLALTRENLRTVYNAVRVRNVKKGDKTVKGNFNTRWKLIVTPDLEETAWEILKQDRLISGTLDTQGDRNYWFNRLDIDVFPQLDNDTYHADAASNVWGILPVNRRLMPYVISYLNGQRRPRTEVVDMPADMLGFGVRGYWDVNIDEARAEAVAWSMPEA